MKLKDIKIGVKLNSGFGLILLLTLLIGVIGYLGISKISYQIEISKLANRIIVDAGDAQAGSLRYIIYGDDKYYNIVEAEAKEIYKLAEELKGLLLSEENIEKINEIEHFITKYEEDNVKYYELEKQIHTIHSKRAEAALKTTNEIIHVIEEAITYSRRNKGNYAAAEMVFLLQDARNAMNRVRITANKYVNDPTVEHEETLMSEINKVHDVLEKDEQLMVTKKMKEEIHQAILALETYKAQFIAYKEIREQEKELFADMRVNAAGLLADARELREGVYDFIHSTKTKSTIELVLFILLAMVIGFTIGIVLTRNIVKPLAKGIVFANSISNGDLTKELKIVQKDEVGNLADAMRNMSAKLKEIVGSVVSGANSIASASNQISSTAENLSQGASEQASSVEEVSSTMEEIAANIEQNSDNAVQTEKISKEAETGINEVAERAQKTNVANTKIADKISIINDIAFQTNILALNAAVEAARAGEHGKGFAVVAAEVRKLAERSKVAADEIVGLADESLDLSQGAGKKMEETLPNVVNTTKLVQEIASASQEQNNGAAQVNTSIQQLNTITQQNAAASEEMSTSAEELASQAEQLRDMVSFFNIGQSFEKKNLRIAPGKDKNFVHVAPEQTNGSNTQGKTITLTDAETNDNEFESF